MKMSYSSEIFHELDLNKEFDENKCDNIGLIINIKY